METMNNTASNVTIKLPKAIIFTGKILNFFSSNLASKYCSFLFQTPLRLPVPQREQHMINSAAKRTIEIPELAKSITTYELGNGTKKILLVHGWSGRGTQLVSIAEAFVNLGFKIISFDAPGHGKSKGRISDMAQFISCIHELEKTYNGFDYAIGHSLGAMSLLNATHQNFKIKKLITIGAADIISEIIKRFIINMDLTPNIAQNIKVLLDKKFEEDIDNYSSHKAAQGVVIPTLVIHDIDDVDVPVSCAYQIRQNLAQGSLLITSGLGHRKILGDEKVIQSIITFITTNKTYE